MTPKRKVRAAAIYTRISLDRHDGAGVERQEHLCRELAERLGWPVAQVFTDNDRSAYSGKRRPSYEQMLDAIERGAIDAVLVVDTDRLVRRVTELASFIDLADQRRVALANISGDINLSTSDGRLTAQQRGAYAEWESAKKSERVKRQREQMARAGKAVSNVRPFGYEPDRVTIRESEADLIREAAHRIIAGGSVRGVATDWLARGVVSTNGKPFTSQRVRALLRNPRLVGVRRYQPRDRHGRVERVEQYEAAWAPILDRDTFDRLQRVFDHNATGVHRRGMPTAHLLTGIAVCGSCGGTLVASWMRGRRRYACRTAPGVDNLGCVSIAADPVDEYVRDSVVGWLAGPASWDVRDELTGRVTRLDADAEPYRQVIARCREERADIVQRKRAGELTLDLAREFDEQISAELESAERALAKLEAQSAAWLDLLPPDLASVPYDADREDGSNFITAMRARLTAAMAGEDIERQRALVRAAFARIEVKPAAKRGRQPFDSGRVRLVPAFGVVPADLVLAPAEDS